MSQKTKLITSFWIFGLINNLLYVVILSAAVDLVGPSLPKGLVLFADVMPSFLFKLTAPFYFNGIPYHYKVASMVLLSFLGMQLVAHRTELSLKLFGVGLASLSSGMGEVTFLQLTHFYKDSAVNAWSSGTGGAGLVGSFMFMAMTSWARFTTKITLLIFSFFPFLIVWVYFRLLPRSSSCQSGPEYEWAAQSIPIAENGSTERVIVEENNESVSLSILQRIQNLCMPFIFPLVTVYVAEYVINQGISPTLLYQIDDMPMFREYRDAYVMYNTLYQIGVFVSRSSATVFRIRKLWLTAMLQVLNVALAIFQSLYVFNPSVYITFAFMVYEGLLGGAAYVNTFMLVREQVPSNQREFSMGAVSMSDSCGVVLAALISMWLEPSLCSYQVSQGRPWCQM